MKKRLLKKLFAITLSLALILALTACMPDIHIHTGEQSSTDSTGASENAIASNEDAAPQDNKTDSKVETDVASSEPQKSDKDTPKQDKPDSTASKATSSKSSSKSSPKSSSKSTSSKASSSGTISKSKAKSIALKDAGLKAADIYDYEIELDRDHNVTKYDISFESGGKDYDYEINATTGKIISVEKPNATSSAAKISKSKAKSTALNHAGVKAADISRYQIELEKDDGVWKYEISFNVGNVEYDYTINAENGKILKSEKDIDD